MRAAANKNDTGSTVGVTAKRTRALWHIVITRMVCDERTRTYIARRMEQGRTKKEAMRCLKRFIAREIYHQLPRQQLALDRP